MNSWKNILEQQQALVFDASSSSTMSYIPLPELGTLAVSGDDAQTLLQSLLTNDVSALNINESQLSSLCNAKGRLFSIFRLVRHENFYQIIVPLSMITLLQQRLSMYVLRSKVTISNESENTACIGLISTNSTSLPVDIPSSVFPQEIPSLNDIQRYLCIIPHEQLNSLLTALQEQNWKLAATHLWEQANIEAGIPTIHPETKEKFTPQQVNLDLIDGVSFSKGCYPGQEIVARLHYLGKPSRRMWMAEAEAMKLPTLGDDVTTESGSTAGHIVCLQQKDGHTIQLLVSLKLSEQNNTLFIAKTTELKLLMAQGWDIADE